MHDLDRMTLDENEFEYEQGFADDRKFEYEQDDMEFENEYEGDMYEDEFEFEFEEDGQASPLSEDEELELATELLNAQSDDELEYFFRSAFRAVKRFAKSKRGGRLFRGLKRSGKRVAGRALRWGGRLVGGPVGGRLASVATRKLGLELEGMSPEDQEFEVAKRIVRFNAEMAKQAAMAPEGMSDQEVIRRAARRAAAQHLPGLVGKGRRGRDNQDSGRWYRRGNRIVLTGI